MVQCKPDEKASGAAEERGDVSRIENREGVFQPKVFQVRSSEMSEHVGGRPSEVERGEGWNHDISWIHFESAFEKGDGVQASKAAGLERGEEVASFGV